MVNEACQQSDGEAWMGPQISEDFEDRDGRRDQKRGDLTNVLLPEKKLSKYWPDFFPKGSKTESSLDVLFMLAKRKQNVD